ncbi:sigma-70 family RNA polymerase sigma factor [Siminovitchia sp. FSL H7-0308]|uniref:RNA polymerase sigma factor (Sigma-70 family) n=1 Tax=Siminovitchia thermophila TaxID=1245522 RepID=A0ABS2R313_9BACI|nr:sigma-70 family RNA polymerase sigma factor [Siminovitchia thermophila]MBM7714041.1 RNA polymerase sigma factor (sigma-70 family) [Siminovitchia thermophila]
MENQKSCCKFLEFIKENKKFLSNPIIKSFLSTRKHFELFKQSICHPTPQNQELLDQAFREFYFRIRFTAYVSKTLHYHGVNMDKKIRQDLYRFPAMLDEPVKDDTELTYKDLAAIEEDFELKSDNILDYVTDPALYKAIQSLTPNQRDILSLSYIKGLTDSEIGTFLGKSQQAVSKARKKALSKMRKLLRKDD